MNEDSFLLSLPVEQRDELFARGQRRRYPAGSTVFFEGDATHEVLVVLEGQAKSVVTSFDGRDVILGVHTPGALLGELGAIDHRPRSASVMALDQLDVLAVRCDDFDAFLDHHPAVLRRLAVVLSSRLRESDRRQLEFGAGDALGRLCSRLVAMMDHHCRDGESPEGPVTFESTLSQSELAAWAGLSREAVVKSMRSLRSLGWLTNEGSAITVLDPDAVRARAET